MTARPRRSGRTAGTGGRCPLLAKLHIARKEMGLEEDDYRDLLERVTGKRSAGEMTTAERQTALAELERLGWKPSRKGPGIEARRDLRFIHVLWKLLSDAGVTAPGRGALNAFICAPNFRAKWGEAPTDLRFLTQERAQDVIEALKDMARRNDVALEPRR